MNTIGGMMQFVWSIVRTSMNVKMSVGQYYVSFWELFVYSVLGYYIFKFFFAVGGSGR